MNLKTTIRQFFLYNWDDSTLICKIFFILLIFQIWSLFRLFYLLSQLTKLIIKIKGWTYTDLCRYNIIFCFSYNVDFKYLLFFFFNFIAYKSVLYSSQNRIENLIRQHYWFLTVVISLYLRVCRFVYTYLIYE